MKTPTAPPDEPYQPNAAIPRSDAIHHFSYSLHQNHPTPSIPIAVYTPTITPPIKKPNSSQQFRHRGNSKASSISRPFFIPKSHNNITNGSYNSKSVYSKAGGSKYNFQISKDPTKINSQSASKALNGNRSRCKSKSSTNHYWEENQPLSSLNTLFHFAQGYYSLLHDSLGQIKEKQPLNDMGFLQVDDQWHHRQNQSGRANNNAANSSVENVAAEISAITESVTNEVDEIAKASLNLVLKLLLNVSENKNAEMGCPKLLIENPGSGVQIDPWLALSSSLTMCSPADGSTLPLLFPSESDSYTLDDFIAKILSQVDKATPCSAVISALMKIVVLQASFIGAFHGQNVSNLSDNLSQISLSAPKQDNVNLVNYKPFADEATTSAAVGVPEIMPDVLDFGAKTVPKNEYDTCGRRPSNNVFRTESAFEMPQIDLDDLLKPVDKLNSNELKCQGLCQRRCDIHPCVQKCIGIEKLHKNVKCCIRQELLKIRNKSPISCYSNDDGQEDEILPGKPRSNTDWAQTSPDLDLDLYSCTHFVDELDLRPSWMKTPRLYSHIMDQILSPTDVYIENHKGSSHPLFYIEWNILGLKKQMNNLSGGSRIVSPRFQPTPIDGKVKCPLLAPLRMMITFENQTNSTSSDSPLRIGLGFTLAGDLDVCYRVFHPEYISPPRWHSFRERPWAGVKCCECVPISPHYLYDSNVVTVGLIIEDLRPGGSIDKNRLTDIPINNVKPSVWFCDEARKCQNTVGSVARHVGARATAKSEDILHETRLLDTERSASVYDKGTADTAELQPQRMNQESTMNSTVHYVNGQNDFENKENPNSITSDNTHSNVVDETTDSSCNCPSSLMPQKGSQLTRLEKPVESSSCAMRAADLPCVLQLLVGYRKTSKQCCPKCTQGFPSCAACVADGLDSVDASGVLRDDKANVKVSEDCVVGDVLNHQLDEKQQNVELPAIPDEETRVTSLPLQTSLSKMELSSLTVEQLPVIRATKSLFNRIWKTKGEHDPVDC